MLITFKHVEKPHIPQNTKTHRITEIHTQHITREFHDFHAHMFETCRIQIQRIALNTISTNVGITHNAQIPIGTHNSEHSDTQCSAYHVF